MGRLVISHSGAEARAHAWTGQWGTTDGPYSQGYDYDVWGNVTHKYGWGGEVQGGGAGQSSDINYSYTGNRRNGFTYDAAGNLTNDLGQQFTYDATGQQATASFGLLQQNYDGNGLRVKKSENGTVTYYLRSTVLGGQVVAEISGGGSLNRAYVYAGGQLLAMKQSNNYYWVHEDPITKSKRVVDRWGQTQSTIELDPWGADTNRSNNAAFQPKKFTSYERDGNGSDEAMFRRYNRWHSRFDQPDPYSGSYDLTNPQSFNRFAYVQGDPTNFTDPTGLYFCLDPSLWEFYTGYYHCEYSPGGSGPPRPLEPKPGGGGGAPQNPQQLTPQQRAEQLLDDCLVEAMLEAIAWAEGTASDADGGYGRVVRGTVISAPNNPGLVGQSNVTITNFAQHPNILVQVQPGLNSTAAGRYQFLNGTWNGLGLPDFRPYYQNVGAVMLLQQAGSITPLLAGNVILATSNANGTWASLPNSPHGQPTRQMADFQQVYDHALEVCRFSVLRW